MLETLIQDIRYGARSLRKTRGFTAIALGTLALGIGANTTIFSVVDHVLLRPLPYRQPQRLFAVHESVPVFSRIAPLIPVNAMHFVEWRRSAQSFEQMALVGAMSMNLTGNGDPERLPAARVSATLFSMLGTSAQLGRTFLDEEDEPGRDRVVVLDDQVWRRRFAADPGVIGRKILLDGTAYEVVGVLPPAFSFPKISQLYAMTLAGDRPQVWKPFAIGPNDLSPMGDFNYACIVSLRDGVSMAAASAELNGLQTRIAAGISEKVQLQAALVPLRDQITGRARTGIQLVFAAAALVLLIGCVNIANLLLTRASGRRREIAIRSAIGASRWRLAREMLTESLLLSIAGGAIGAIVAYAGVAVLARLAPIDLPRLDELHVDSRILLFTLGVSLAVGALFGFVPAWRGADADPQDTMRPSTGTTASAKSGRLRGALVAIEVALGALCLAIGGLLLHSLMNTLGVDGGFEADRVVTMNLNLPQTRYPDLLQRVAFTRTLLERAQGLPGITAVGVSNMLPLAGEGYNNAIHLDPPPAIESDQPLIADIRLVSPEYFHAMGIPLRSGRMFSDTDHERPLGLVSSITAQRFWPGQSPIGKRFRIGATDSPSIEVIGVVGDIHGVSLTRTPSLTVYVPYWQRSRPQISLVVRTSAAATGMAAPLRSIVRAIDPELPVPAPRTMDDIVTGSVAQPRFQTRLVLAFGVIAVLLASLGIFGVVSYSVLQRTTEIGIRLALGARPGGIRGMVLRQSLVPVAVGLIGGIAAGVVTGRLMTSVLFGVNPADPLAIGGVIVVLGGVAMVAAYLPARRATAVDPMRALRAE